MIPNTQGTQKTPGSIRNNPAFQKFQNVDNPTSAPGTKPIPPKPEQRGRQPATQTGETKVLYPSASHTTTTDAAPSNAAPAPSETRSRVSRSRSGSESPTKLVQRKRSTDLPRVSRVQKSIANELGASPEITQVADAVMPQVIGRAANLRLNLTELKRSTLSETTQPAATARARAPERGEAEKSQKARSASPKKKLPSADSPQRQPDSASNKKKSGLLNLFKSPSSHRKDSKAGKTEKTPKPKRGTEAQVRSPRSPEITSQPTLTQKSSPILKPLPPTPQVQAQESPAPQKSLPKPPEAKQPAVTVQPQAMPAQPEAVPTQTQAMPQQSAEVAQAPAEVPLASTVSPREEAATPVQTTEPQAAQEKPASEATQRRTPREPGSPLSDKGRPAPKPLLKPKTPPATPTTVSTTQTDTHKDPDSKNET